MNELLKAIKAWVESFDADFEAFKKTLEKQLLSAEASIYRRVLADVLPKLGQENGVLKAGVSNLAKANLIERVFDEMAADEMQPILKAYAEKLLGITGKNAEYYILTGFDKAKVEAISEDLTLIRSIIGVDAKGNLLNSGYLSRLGQSEFARERIKQFVLTSIATKQSVSAFEKGLKNLIVSTADIEGALIGYWRQYAYDTHAKIREVDNLHFADELELDDFIYQGGIIKTSRDFCIKKNGKVFTRQEARVNWPKDPDLIDKKHIASYKPLIDRGRNNCRHFLMWITPERANELRARQ